MLTPIKILMILTSHAIMGDTGKPTGVWFEEVATPYYAFIDAGAQVDIVSIAGGKVPIDPRSLKSAGENPKSVDRFLKDTAAMRKIEASLKVDQVTAQGYNAVFLPGGHGTMWDLPNSTALSTLVSNVWTSGKVVAAVCHGPAGLVNAMDEAGRPIVAGRRVSAFTNTEEKAAGLTQAVPFLLETRLRELGARFEGAPDFQAYSVRDGRLVTGQNPASSEDVARLTLEAVKETAASSAAVR
jgi:putative intracellular protease/amidase